MSRTRKPARTQRAQGKKGSGKLAPLPLVAGDADSVKGGNRAIVSNQASSKPVARYYLENAWPSK